MPALNVWFTDAAIPGSVSSSQALVRLAHYSHTTRTTSANALDVRPG